MEDLQLEKLDVSTSFLYGDLEGKIYTMQPQGFEVQENERIVCRLQNSFYDLKQAPRERYKKFDNFKSSNDFRRCEEDQCYYVKYLSNSYIILLLHIHCMYFQARNKYVRKELSKESSMKDFGVTKENLRMRISRDSDVLRLLYVEYANNVLRRYMIDDAKSVSTHLHTLTPLLLEVLFIPWCVKDHLAHAVGVVSRYMSNLSKHH